MNVHVIRWSVIEDRWAPGTWRVEGFSQDGEDCYCTIFSGPHSKRRADLYYNWVRGA